MQSNLPHAVCWRFLTNPVQTGELILDVGCGKGELMTDLINQGGMEIGAESNRNLVNICQSRGLDVREGCAERLPFSDATFDRIVCSVVVPYTDERLAVAEWQRVVKAGGRIFATYHGVGYALNYITNGHSLSKSLYGVKMLLHTFLYWAISKRFPSFLGDTLCQGSNRLILYYKSLGLILDQEIIPETTLGFPRFICHYLSKPHTPDD